MSDFWSRLDELIKQSTNGIDSAFEKKSKLKGGYIRKTINERRNMKPEFIESILANHPNLNKNWLINGKGNMWVDEEWDWKSAAEYKLFFTIKNQIQRDEPIKEELLKAAYLGLFEKLEKIQGDLNEIIQGDSK